jgi:hypothetical protein
MEYLHIELSFALQSTRINQNGFIALNSRFQSNQVLLEKDLVLFKIRPNLHESKRQWRKGPDSNYYEYNVEHLVDLGYYLPDKPPSSDTVEKKVSSEPNIRQYFIDQRPLTDIVKNQNNLENSLLCNKQFYVNSVKKMTEQKVKNSNYISNFSPQLLMELRSEIQRRESFKNVSCVKDDKAPSISTVPSTSDTEENDFDVTFYKYRREIEQKMYYIDDTIQSERA